MSNIEGGGISTMQGKGDSKHAEAPDLFIYFILLFICAYIVWAISPPATTPLTSKQNLFCLFLQFS
jgi:hypothetical protein